jgi:hypothetical protein
LYSQKLQEALDLYIERKKERKKKKRRKITEKEIPLTGRAGL